MRSLLGFIVFTAAFIAALALVLVPIVVPPLVTTAVRQALPFEGAALDVSVDVDALGVARGVVGEIRVSGREIAVGPKAHVGSLELTIDDMRLDRRGFAAIRGTARDAVVTLENETAVAIASIDLSGSSADVQATARIAPQATLELVQSSLVKAGIDPGRIELVDGGVSIEVLGQPVRAALRVEDGSLVIASFFGGGPIVLLGPEPGDPWRFERADVSVAGIVLDASVDAAAVLEQG